MYLQQLYELYTNKKNLHALKPSIARKCFSPSVKQILEKEKKTMNIQPIERTFTNHNSLQAKEKSNIPFSTNEYQHIHQIAKYKPIADNQLKMDDANLESERAKACIKNKCKN
ncbi:hypothetical protein Tsp_04212 [Trichinella spiralis]|uniref:hypothetical protein n=1 Tax=Trichinella spiralis TaxID=6334 RepID=UPI0001EFBD18|nr:hypothetical protein Tsp_04212 [Trichinella spiralis]